MKKVSVGIDIGGTNTAVGIVNREGQILAHANFSTTKHPEINHFLDTLHKTIEAIFATLSSEYQIIGLGIGAPNGNYYKGTIEFAPNLKWSGIVPIVDLFHKYYPQPIFLSNDANTAAIGEMIYGAAQGMNDFIVITLGTGLGSGIVANGKLIYGHDGFAGEIGHTIVDPNGRECGCGRKGCLETYASATGICRTLIELLATTNIPSIFRDTNPLNVSAKQIADAANQGDKLALKAFDYTANILGLKLADTVAHTSPEAIFLFGGLAQAGDLIITPTKNYMEKYLLKIYNNKVKVLASGLPASNAAILGASALVWSEVKCD